MVYPVVHALKSSNAVLQGKLEITVLALPAAKRTLEANAIKPLGFQDFLNANEDADAIAWGKSLAEKHHSPTIGATFSASAAYLGLNYKDLVLQHGDAGAAELFAQKGRQAFFPVHLMARVFDRLKPDFVVTSNSPRSEAAAIAVANTQNIDNLIMTDLFTGLSGYVLEGKSITFLNEFAKDMFIADGLVKPSSQLYCTGNAAFDRIGGLSCRKDDAWLAENFPRLGKRKVVLHADMPAYWDSVNHRSHIKTEQENIAELDACYAATRANSAFYLVRPHPSQERLFYEKWLTGKPDAALAADCDLHELLASIDLLIARTTTVGLEAALMRKRILQLDCELHTDLPLASMGIAWGVNGYPELASEMHVALTDEKKFFEIRTRMDLALPAGTAAFKIADIVLGKLGLS